MKNFVRKAAIVTGVGVLAMFYGIMCFLFGWVSSANAVSAAADGLIILATFTAAAFALRNVLFDGDGGHLVIYFLGGGILWLVSKAIGLGVPLSLWLFWLLAIPYAWGANKITEPLPKERVVYQ